MRVPSGEKAAVQTAPSCFMGRPIAAPVAASHSRAVLSSDAVTMRVPSGEKAADQTRSSCSHGSADRRAGRGVPQSRRLVLATR